MAKKDTINEVQELEKESEIESDAAEKDEPMDEAGKNTDEVAEELESVEEGTDTNEVMPAEIAAINTDNDTANEATEGKEINKEVNDKLIIDKVEKKGSKMANEKFDKLIEQIENLTTLELAELVKALEEKFGVSAAAPMMAAAAPVVAAEAEEEKSSYTLVLADSGAQKIAVIKALREINQELGLKEAKDLADGAPKEIKKDMPKAEAEEAKKKLEAAGAKVELK